MAEADPDPKTTARQDYDQALVLVKEGKNREALPLFERALAAMPEDLKLQADYILCLTWTGSQKKAVELFERNDKDLGAIPYVPRHVARAYYDLWEYQKALELYRLALSYDPKDEEAFKGVTYSYLRLGDTGGAYDTIEKAEQDKTVSTTMIISMRKLAADLYGVRRYDELRAAEDADSKDPEAGRIGSSLRKVRWEEYGAAISELRAILEKNPENMAARGDLIVALSRAERMTEALEQYGILKQSGMSIQWWANEAVGNACLYLHKPEEAKIHYQMALEGNPENPFNALIGLVNAYTDLRRWDRADATLQRIDFLMDEKRRKLEDDPSVKMRKQYIADRNNVIVVKGWYLLAQDKLKEAETYFDDYLTDAAANTNLRTGLAHAYLWRNWPHRAQEQFEVVRELDPKNRKGLTGLGWTLREMNYRQEAIALTEDLYKRYPNDPHVRDLWETLQFDMMWHLQPDFYFVKEFTGSTEYGASLLLEKPITPLFALYAQFLRVEAWDDSDDETDHADWNRVGFGYRWIVLPELVWWMGMGFDVTEGDDFGLDTRLQWRPTEPLRVTAEYSSFSLSVPIRAASRGITADRASVDLLYVESDLREYGIGGGSQWFSDDNVYTYGTARYNQNLYNHPDIKIRGGIEAYYGTYSKQDVDYYSPEYEWNLLLTPSIRWVNFIRYERKWFSAVYFRGGISGQDGYSTYPVGGITFEQTYEHSKTLNLTGGVSYDLRTYDGVYTHVLGLYLVLNWHF